MALAVAVLLGACLSGPTTISREWQEQLETAPLCEIKVEDVDASSWRQVRSRGFRVCVPPDWRLLRRPTVTRDPYGSGRWQTPELIFEWTFGPGQSARDCAPDIVASGRARHQWFERIGEQDVCIVLGVRGVRAYWNDGLIMGGNARDQNNAARLLGVVRTVRLASELPPPGAPPP